LLIIVHLFCVIVALSSYQRQSQLQARLLELFAAYTRTLNFAPLSAPYQLSSYDPISGENAADDDLYIEVEVRQPDGTVKTVDLKQLGLSTPEAARRFRAYAAEMFYAVAGEDSNSATRFAQAAGGFVLKKSGVESGILRLKRHMSQPRRTADLEAGFPPDNPHAPQYVLTLYEADVSWFEGDPAPLVNKREGVGQTAPVRSVNPRSGTPSIRGQGAGVRGANPP
jgi:hypothetical protein